MKKILLIQKSVYGRDLFYPGNDLANHFCRLTRTKTLDADVISVIKALGFEVEIKSEFEIKRDEKPA